MESNINKYKEHIFTRYFILKEGLFKNTKKLLNIYKDSVMIENIEETEREIISFEDIVNVVNLENNQKDFKITYRTNKTIEISLTFSSVLRTQIVCDLLRQIDLYSKVNQIPVESFRCYMAFENNESVFEGLKRDSSRDNGKLINYFDITLNIYRSIIEFIPLESKREIRVRFSDVENVKIFDNSILKFEMFNKIDLYIIPKNNSNIKLIIEKFLENCKSFLGYEVNVEFCSSKDIALFAKNFSLPKTKLFTFSKINRILYNSSKIELSLTADYDYLYEVYENNSEGVSNITKINKIPINEISYLIMYESDRQFFEVVTKNCARFLYQTSQNERDIIITNLVDLISNKDESNFLLLPSKPKLGMKIMGFLNDEVDWEYERQLFSNLYVCFNDAKLRERIVEDIVLNFCFKSDKFKLEPVFNKKIYQMIYGLIPEELNNLDNIIKNNEEANKEQILQSSNNIFKKASSSSLHLNLNVEKIIKKSYTINIFLILCKNLFVKSHYDKMISDILNYVENCSINSNYNFQTIFYNSISIFKNLIQVKSGILKKEELAQRKWMVSSHFDNAIKIKKMLFSKIFNINTLNAKKQKLENFEQTNALSIYILMELQKSIYEFCNKETNIMADIIKEFNQFDFLYILYILMRCSSAIMKQVSIEMLIILVKSLSIQQEYNLKNLILTRTLIFCVLLNIYIKSPNDITNILTLKFLKSFLISHVEATTLMLNIFPMTLFYYIDKKPNPINWLDHEWDNFFKAILRDHNTTSLIWNQLCRNELFDYLNKVIERYEYFTQDNSMVLAFHLENDEREKEIPSYNLYKAIVREETVSGYLNLNSNNTKFTYIDRESQNSPILKTPINCSFYCFNYKEIKMVYQTLKKHVFVWQYYLKRIINESGRPSLSHQIDKPKKFWKKLMNEITVSSNENKIILIVKTLTLLYKQYFETIGIFKEYDYFIKLFNSTNFVSIKIMIIQMFLVTVELEEKEIKEPNLKNLIELKAPEFFINFIPQLITNDYLRNSVDKIFTYESVLSEGSQNKPSYTFLDNKSLFIKNLQPDDINFDKKFANYTNYVNIDDSWFTADKNIKATTLIIRLFKLLLKRFSIIDEKLQKINFPLPKIKFICYDINNFTIIISLLFSENENLVIEALDLILNFMNDPLNYKNNANKTILVDVLVFYMIKYKSKSIMKFLENLYYYHNVFFDFDFLLKNSLLDEDEIEFLNQYPNANKFLIRYFPHNLIYYYNTTDFQEYIKILFEENLKTDLIWNSDMLKYLVEKFNALFKFCFENKENYNLNFNETFKINYPVLKERKICFLYYLDIYTQVDKKAKIDNSHINIFSRCLYYKLKNKIDFLNKNLSSDKEIFDEELFIYLASLNNLIKSHNLTLGDFTSFVTELYNRIIEKENEITDNEQKIVSVILNSMHLSISNTKNNEQNENAFNLVILLIKAFVHLLKKMNSSKSENVELEIISIIKSIIEIIQKQPKILDNLDRLNGLETVYDYLHKILYVQVIEKLKDSKSKTFKFNFEDENTVTILNLILDLFTEYSNNLNSIFHIVRNGILLEILYLCLKFNIRNNEPNCINELSLKSCRILKRIVLSSLDYKEESESKRFLNRNLFKDTYEALINIFDKQLIKEFTLNNEADNLLLKIKSKFENPEFIWNKNLRKELKSLLLFLLEKIYSNSSVDYLTELKNFKFASCKTELKVGSIYVKIYNKNPNWAIGDPDSFLNSLKDVINSDIQKIENNSLSKEEISNYCDNLNEILNSISNIINFSSANENILLNDTNFINNFYKLLRMSFEKDSNNSRNLLVKEKIVPSGMNILQTFSLKLNSLGFVLNAQTFFVLINIIERNSNKESLEPIIKILRNVVKIPEYVEKTNLSIFLFLLKKIIFLKETITKSTKDNINSLRVEFLKIIKKFISNEKVGFAIKGLFEFYLPLKIIDNLFSSKEITENNLTWVDSELELPDLIWNYEAINQSKKLLEEDCTFILNDESNLESFPNNLLTHKLDPHKTFFFEITDEFRIDNIYLRIFNKDPSYNIGKNLIIFLKDVINVTIETFQYLSLLNFNMENLNSKSQLRLMEIIKQKLITCLTAICLIIEQINFNDFNDNLGISSQEEMKNVIKLEEEKSLLNLVQRSFDFPKLLSNSIVNKLLSIGKFILGLEDNLYYNFSHFDNNIRLVYLQIIYLITLNKHCVNIISENLNVVDVLEKMYNYQDKIGDFEFVVILCIFSKIISHDISHISGFLTRLFDKYVELSNKRTQLLKYIQLVFCKIINDTQYGDSIVNSVKADTTKYKNFPITIAQKLGYYESQVSQIWRKAPDTKEQANIIYKINHQTNFVEDNLVKSSGTYQNFEARFPFLPKQSTTYFNINDISKEELNTISENCFSYGNNLELVEKLKNTMKCFDELLEQ